MKPAISLIDLISLFTDDTQKVVIYSLNKQKEVYEGIVREIPEEYESHIVDTIQTLQEPTDVITLNIISKHEEV